MFPVTIEGESVRLREITRHDTGSVQRWTGDDTTVAHVPLGPTTAGEAATYVRQLVRESRQRPRRVVTLGIVDRRDDDLVGTVGLTIDSVTHRRAEVGYILRRDRWRAGLATEAVSLMLDLAFGELGLHRVWAACDVDNPASVRVLEKCGFVLEGRLRADLRIGDEFRDAWLYAVLEDDRPSRPIYL